MKPLVAFVLSLLVSLPAWSAGRLGFAASWEGEYFDTLFRDYSLRLEPAPGGGRLVLEVQVDSLDSENVDRDTGMRDPEWFDTAQYPVATFTADPAVLAPGRRVELSGMLQLKGRAKPLRFPVAVERAGGGLLLRGDLEVDRRDFDIGSGEWREDDAIGYRVKIFFELPVAAVAE